MKDLLPLLPMKISNQINSVYFLVKITLITSARRSHRHVRVQTRVIEAN